MELIQELNNKEFGKYKDKMGLYKCPICSQNFATRIKDVVRGSSTKCRSCASTTHGKTNTKLYKVWKSIKSRCTKVNDQNYERYGGRGILICDEWKFDFENFYNWSMNNNYKEKSSIDRINNDGNYEPSNCRFTTREVQCRNTRLLRKTNTSGYRGAFLNKKTNSWKAQISVNNKMIYLGEFKTAIDAGYAYDKFVICNNFEHTTNGLYDTHKDDLMGKC